MIETVNPRTNVKEKVRMLPIMKRRIFYAQVRFKDKRSKECLCKPILHWAKEHGKWKFFNITNYVSHATINSEEKFDMCYPITISGKNLLDICIEDANKKLYHIALAPNQIVYFKKQEGEIEIFGAKVPYKSGKDIFYCKKISYTVEE